MIILEKKRIFVGAKDTGQIARLEVAQFINEPTAVVLAYGLNNKSNSKTVVYHLGCGTFDCSIIDVADGFFEVLSTNGDAHSECNDRDKALKN
jgi:molecular chaperone DnaK